MRTTTRTLAGLVLATGLGLTGCGDDVDAPAEIPPVEVPEVPEPGQPDDEPEDPTVTDDGGVEN